MPVYELKPEAFRSLMKEENLTKMTLIPKDLEEPLRSNWRTRAKRTKSAFDPEPVLRLFTPDSNCTWLITEQNPKDPDALFGLADLGCGFPELGYVSLAELTQARGIFGLPIERDLHFEPKGTIGQYLHDALRKGYIDSQAEITPASPR